MTSNFNIYHMERGLNHMDMTVKSDLIANCKGTYLKSKMVAVLEHKCNVKILIRASSLKRIMFLP